LPDSVAKMVDATSLAESIILFQGYDRVSEKALWRDGGVHDIRQHGAGLDRGELIAVTEEDYAAALRQSVEELG
jgi:hypothetical protein